ncbi:MAG: aldehyde dehydrogenase family protein [bacterium]|nr:aldehyde dehydrogenase family protein [bacterium]
MPNVIPRIPEPENSPFVSFAKGTAERTELERAIKNLREETKYGDTVFPLWINGPVLTGKTKECLVPHNLSRRLGSYAVAGEEHVYDAIGTALTARKRWSQIPWFIRINIFQRAARLLEKKYLCEAVAAVMEDYSKNPYEAFIDVQELIDFWNFNAYYASWLYRQQPNSNRDMSNFLDYRPLEGFILAIPPNNFVAINGNLCTAPLIMGNVVVVKPSSDVVYSFHKVILKALFEAGLPRDVLTVIHGSGKAIGDIAMSHPQLSGVHFTGGTDTFNDMWKTIAKNIEIYDSYPRLVGETGGKDAIVVYDSYDPIHTAVATVMGGFGAQGRKCSATSRVYMTEEMWLKVRKPLCAFMDTIGVGDVADFRNYMGAIINESETKKIAAYITEAQRAVTMKRDGVKEVHGGGNPDGWFIRPTVIATDNPHYKTMQEEIFGPVVTICVLPKERFEKEVKQLCNKTSPYGLTGAIHTNDIYEYCEALEELRYVAGNLYDFKTTGAMVNFQPFSGGRKSGTNSKVGWWTNLLQWVELGTVGSTFVKSDDFAPPYLDRE